MAQNDAAAKTSLDKMSKKFQAYKGAFVEFTLTMENAQEKIKETSKGKAWTKGKAYKIELMGAETFFDGVTQWTYMKDAGECNISTPDLNNENTFNPSKLFTSYTTGYKIRYIKDVFENNRALQIIDLFPIDVKKSEFNRIRLKLDKDKNTIYQIIRYGKDGNDYTITVVSLKEETALADVLFKFDKAKYPNVELIDLR